jgi:ketosteroid isomerase-like protein
MSQENVELVKALYPQPDVDMAELVRNEHTFAVICEAISPLLTDDFHVVDVLPGTTRTYAGLEGFRQNWLDWLEPWATYRSTIDEAIDLGERVLLLIRDHARREEMDAEVEMMCATITTIRDGQVARIEFHNDRARALKAAGLSEQDISA